MDDLFAYHEVHEFSGMLDAFVNSFPFYGDMQANIVALTATLIIMLVMPFSIFTGKEERQMRIAKMYMATVTVMAGMMVLATRDVQSRGYYESIPVDAELQQMGDACYALIELDTPVRVPVRCEGVTPGRGKVRLRSETLIHSSTTRVADVTPARIVVAEDVPHSKRAYSYTVPFEMRE